MLKVDKALSDNEDAIGIGRKGTINKPYLLRAPFWTVDTLFYSLPRHANDLEFLFGIFQIINWKAKDESTGVPSLSKTSINSTIVSVPTYEEQQKIGFFIMRLDDTITLHQRKLAQLQVLKNAYLQRLFPSETEKVPKLRFANFTDSWEQRKFENHAIYRRGSFPQPYGNKEWYDGKNSMPFVQVVDVDTNLKLVKDTKQKISALAQQQSVFVPAGKVIVTLQGSIGRVAITQYDAYFDRTILIFEDYQDTSDDYFWAYSIKRKFDVEKEKAPGGTIKTITKAALSEFEVAIPSIHEQKRIGLLLNHLDNSIDLHHQKLDQLTNLKSAYLQKMFI